MSESAFPPPAGLSEKSEALWAHAHETRNISKGRAALLEEALRALDRATQAAALVDAEGLCAKTESSGALHIHPALRIERENRQLFSRIWSDLGMNYNVDIDGRQKR